MADAGPARMLVTGGAGRDRQLILGSGGSVAANDVSVARGPGYEPGHDLKAGIATVWPEFSETTK
jgi:hypothetical protein